MVPFVHDMVPFSGSGDAVIGSSWWLTASKCSKLIPVPNVCKLMSWTYYRYEYLAKDDQGNDAEESWEL